MLKVPIASEVATFKNVEIVCRLITTKQSHI
jgi:hypothetical protein